MAGQSLEFTISASDQASKVVTSVQKKIDNFGKDVGRSIAGVLGPMALVGFAVSKVTEYLAEMEKKAKEAFDFGAGLSDAAAKLGVTVEQFQQITKAAAATGESLDNVATAYKASTKFLADVKSGNLEALETFEGLGFSISNLEKIKPEDVLARLSQVMLTATDPTQKMAIAMTVLGESAKNLQGTLAKGFNIAAAFEGGGLISDEDAALLAESKAAKKKLELEEQVAQVKEQAREAFSKTEEGRAFINKNTKITSGGSQGFVFKTETASDEQLDAEIKRIGKKKKEDAERAAAIAAADAQSIERAKTLLDIDLQRKKAAEDKAAADKAAGKEPPAPKAEKAPPAPKAAKDQTQLPGEMSRAINVSSLREIGGGMAGEVAVSEEQYKQNQLELLREAVKQLEALNGKNGGVDFTKGRDVAPFNPIKNVA
jgi:hypothetical protein